ncbi:MAG: peroxidase-related enzyme [Sphingomonadales bacterium]
MAYLENLPEEAAMKELYEAYPDVSKPLGAYTQAVMRGPSPLSEGERELVAAFVSGLNACNYCFGVHSAVAKVFGVEPGLLEAIIEDVDAAPVAERLKPLLHYARKLTLAPASVGEGDVAAIRAAGWGDDALFSLVSVAALFNLYNRLVEGAGLEAPEGYFAVAAERLTTIEYDFLPD